MAKDNTTYGFNKADAEELITHLGTREETYREGKPRGGGAGGSVVCAFLAPAGGIPARVAATLGSATCTKLTIAGGTRATTAATYTVYNDFTSAVAGSVDIFAARVNGIWVAIAEDCT